MLASVTLSEPFTLGNHFSAFRAHSSLGRGEGHILECREGGVFDFSDAIRL